MLRGRVKVFLNFIINCLSFLFWALVLIGFNTPYVAVLTLISALIHECGHIAALAFTGNFTAFPRFAVSGMRLSRKPHISYRDELIVIISGPLSNIASFLFFYLLSLIFGEYFFTFALLNLLTAISNLLPIEGYDGYKILNTLLSAYGLGARGYRVIQRISLLFVTLLTFLSLYLIMKVGSGYWIFGIFFVSMLLSLFKSKNIKKRDFGRFREKKRDF